MLLERTGSGRSSYDLELYPVLFRVDEILFMQLF